MGWMGAALSAGSSLIGGLGSFLAGKSQAAAYRNAGQQANNTLANTYNGIVSNETPYTSAGAGAIGTLSKDVQNGTGFASPFTLSNFYSDPGYQFTLQQGTNAVNNSAAARGGLLSGAAAKGLASYTTGLANQTFGDAYNRYLQNRQQGYNELMGVAGLGQTATGQVNQAGLTTGTQSAQNTYNALTGAGNADAAGMMGLFGGTAKGMNSLGQYYMSRPKSQLYGPPGSGY